MREAEILMKGNEYEVDSEQVLTLAHRSKCTAHNCEFVMPAMRLGLKLVTSDKKLLTDFLSFAVLLQVFTA
jgi:predicted nucleic acid-binding protein